MNWDNAFSSHPTVHLMKKPAFGKVLHSEQQYIPNHITQVKLVKDFLSFRKFGLTGPKKVCYGFTKQSSL
jgi:hypothetical protein